MPRELGRKVAALTNGIWVSVEAMYLADDGWTALPPSNCTPVIMAHRAVYPDSAPKYQ